MVVVDVHRFPVGFHEPSAGQVHRQLALLLERELGSFMAPADQRDNATLNQLWAAKKTLIVAYADTATRRDHPLLWPSIPQVSRPTTVPATGQEYGKELGALRGWCSSGERLLDEVCD